MNRNAGPDGCSHRASGVVACSSTEAEVVSQELTLASASTWRRYRPPARRSIEETASYSLYARSDSQARPNLSRKQLRLFPGGEVPAFGEGVEVNEIVVGALGPTPRSLVDLFRKDANGGRNRDVVVVKKAPLYST